jgi:hypothetical protein
MIRLGSRLVAARVSSSIAHTGPPSESGGVDETPERDYAARSASACETIWYWRRTELA